MSCPSGKVISVISAFYGRKNATLCRNDDDSLPVNTNCEAPNTLSMVSQTCDVRSSCTIYTNSFDQFGADPCPDTTKYLQVEYTCYNPGKEQFERLLLYPTTRNKIGILFHSRAF